MKTQNFIIHAPLLNPPTSMECFRQLTMFVKLFNKRIENILIEVNKEEIDFVFRYLKGYPGALDNIYDFIYETDDICGIRLDSEFRKSPTIQAIYIKENNLKTILDAISYN